MLPRFGFMQNSLQLDSVFDTFPSLLFILGTSQIGGGEEGPGDYHVTLGYFTG